MDYEKIAEAVAGMNNNIKRNVALKSMFANAASLVFDDQSNEPNKLFEEFLDSPMGDGNESIMKKVFAAAMIFAKESGILSNLPSGGAEMAAVVDEGLVRVKANYQVGAGILDPEEAIDCIIDHAEARAIAFIDQAFDSGMVKEVVSNGIVAIAYAIPQIGPIIGPMVQDYQPVIDEVLNMVEPQAREAIKTGVRVVATTLKQVAHEAIEKAKELAVNLAEKIESWLA